MDRQARRQRSQPARQFRRVHRRQTRLPTRQGRRAAQHQVPLRRLAHRQVHALRAEDLPRHTFFTARRRSGAYRGGIAAARAVAGQTITCTWGCGTPSRLGWLPRGKRSRNSKRPRA